MKSSGIPAQSVELLNQANLLHRQGNLPGALTKFREALNADPDNFDALLGLGLMLVQMECFIEAISTLKKAASIQKHHFAVNYNLGKAFQSSRRYEEALAVYDEALRAHPDNAKLYNLRGEVLKELKRYDDAVRSFNQSIALAPDYAEAHYNLGNVLGSLGRFEDALESYNRAIAFKPYYLNAFCKRGLALQFMRRYEDALDSYDKAIALDSDCEEAHNSRGNILQQLGRYEEALMSYDQAVALKPDHMDAFYNRGIALSFLKRYTDALASFERAIALRPDYVEAYNNRGNCLRQLKRHTEALLSYDQAIALRPDYAEAHNNRGIVLQNLKRYEDSLSSFERAIALKPDYIIAYYNRGITYNYMKRLIEALADFNKVISLEPNYPYASGYRLAAQMHICLWEDFDHRVKELIGLITQGVMASTPFPLLAIPVPPSTFRKYASEYVMENYPPAPQALWQGECFQHRRIRLGYFSGDFRNHSTAYLIAELIEKHDRSQFELIAFSFGTGQPDEMHARLVKNFDQFHDVSTQSDLEIATLARQLEIDIAIDLMGFTGTWRTGIFALRPAPVQINYHTYAATMGAPYIDYIIADRVAIPRENFEYFSEKVVHLPHCYVVSDSRRPIADLTPTRRAQGLPETGFVFCCFNHHTKITPDVFTIWMRLLTKVAGSVLWLKGIGNNVAIMRNLREEARRRNVDPERLIFAPLVENTAEHLARQRHANLYLDTFYHGAGTTCSDALWVGLPVLTCAGDTLVSRVAASMLHAIDLPELVTQSHEEYEAVALHLATDSEALTTVSNKLARNRELSPLFNTSMFARHIEAAFNAMWRRSQQGLAPDHIFIDP